ncbi:hypothetical protein [Rufibacter sp. LB8]|uniref:hypothetical protein n=2 Tax=Rufibacter sp. LB8 TaxID=2777781 RepID=UPI00178C48BD|nr:hypothetical protein [Rufibacter sp. LB8]
MVETEMSPNETSRLSKFPEFKIDTVHTFLLVLARGPKNIYYSVNSIGKEQFYSQQNGKFEFLAYKRYLKKEEGKEVIAENKKFIGQLALLMNDCPNLHKSLGTVTYSRKSFERLFTSYYQCVNYTEGKIQKSMKIAFEYGVVAGVSKTSIEFESPDFPHLTNSKFKDSYNVTGSLFLNVILPFSTQRLSIYNEAGIYSFATDNHYEDIVHSYYYRNYYTSLDFTYLKLNNFLRYKLPLGTSTIFLQAGVSNSIAVKSDNVVRKEQFLHGEITTSDSEAVPGVRKYEQSLAVGAGYLFKRFSGEFRFEKGNGISIIGNLQNSNTKLFVLLGYRLSK